MRYLIFILLFGCAKSSDDFTFQPKSQPLALRSAFATSVYMGKDSIIPRRDSFAFVEFSSYLATCGFQPELEAPIMGIKVFPILFPSFVYINWVDYQGRIIPTAKNLIPGVYKFVGTAYMLGYRECDSSYQNVEVYDTMTLTVLKKHRYGRQ